MNDLYNDISQLSPEKRKLLEKLLSQQNIDLKKKRILPQSREQNRFPLSYAQQRMWFLDQWEPGNPMYNNPAAVSIAGRVNVDAVKQALRELGKRHEVLRTVFENEHGNPVQVIQPESNIALQQLDVQHLSEDEQQKTLREEANAEAQAPFDLSTGPLLRAKLLRLAEDRHVCLLTMHHIISDAWTLATFIKEFAELYEGFAADTSVSLPELPIQYVDYAVWQRDYLQGEVLEEQLGYWRERLAGADTPLDLPTDHKRPNVQTHNGDVVYFRVPADVMERIESFCKTHDVTQFMTLLAALDVLLYRYSGQEDIVMGTPIANRNRSELEPLLGVFVNTLAVRSDLSGDPTFADLVQRVKQDALGAYAHQDIPFEMLVEELQPERDMSRPPFFQTMFVLQNTPSQMLELADVTIERLQQHTPTAKFDVTFVFEPNDGGLDGQIVYNTDLFESSTIKRLIGHLLNLLSETVAHPTQRISQLNLLSHDEETALVVDNNRLADTPYTGGSFIHRMINGRVAQRPEAQLYCGSESMTYRELNERANRMAHYLIAQGVAPETVVGVYVERSLDLLAAILGIFKAGGVYLPLDPDYPQERLDYMIQDSEAVAILTQSSLATNLSATSAIVIHLDEIEPELNKGDDGTPDVPLEPQHPAYMIYTSGSTGKPKGVLVSHAAFAQHCHGMVDEFELVETDRVLQFASTNFDASLEQIFPTLLAGADLVMRPNTVWTPEELLSVIQEQQLSVVNLPTAYWNQFAQVWHSNMTDVQSPIRLLIVGGDLMSTDSLNAWSQSTLHAARLLNAYGPTETCITATAFDIPREWQVELEEGAIPIGQGLLQRRLYVLDRHGNLVPQGVPGELCIGGFAVARGYWNRPDLTAERFVPNPFSEQGERLYRTGDLVRYNHRGDFQFLGRIDQQVKIRGYRIELGEIEAALGAYPGMQKVIVISHGENSAEKFLVAYYVCEGDEPSVTALRDHLLQRLPDYMIPSVFVGVDHFPLTPSGKIDRRALPVPDQLRPQVSTEFVAPRTETETRIAEIVATVLKIDKVGIYDNFFDLGGHSMLGTQVISRVREDFDVDLSLRVLFENPTVEGITRAIAAEQAALVDENELTSMLQELEGLSDQEIQDMLQNE